MSISKELGCALWCTTLLQCMLVIVVSPRIDKTDIAKFAGEFIREFAESPVD